MWDGKGSGDWKLGGSLPSLPFLGEIDASDWLCGKRGTCVEGKVSVTYTGRKLRGSEASERHQLQRLVKSTHVVDVLYLQRL